MTNNYHPRWEAVRRSHFDSGALDETVHASSRINRCAAYHDDPDCMHIAADQQLRERSRASAQLAWLVPCVQCVLGGAPPKGPLPERYMVHPRASTDTPARVVVAPASD